MKRGGRLSERLTARERDLAGRMKLAFDVHRDSWLSLMIMFCYCQITSKFPARHLCMVNHVCTSYYNIDACEHSCTLGIISLCTLQIDSDNTVGKVRTTYM